VGLPYVLCFGFSASHLENAGVAVEEVAPEFVEIVGSLEIALEKVLTFAYMVHVVLSFRCQQCLRRREDPVAVKILGKESLVLV
jgi:hypothetical protein